MSPNTICGQRNAAAVTCSHCLQIDKIWLEKHNKRRQCHSEDKESKQENNNHCSKHDLVSGWEAGDLSK